MADTTQVASHAVTKRCGVCKQVKPASAFHRHRGHKDGLTTRCKECNARAGKAWYLRRQQETNGLYSTYVAMKQRCHYPKHDNYPHYGGRGIRVCDEWLASFEAFCEWALKNGYQPGFQLDRIDNEKGYSPDNCRFVTPSANQLNKRERETRLRNYTKLTVPQVQEIRRLLRQGVPQREIGRRFGVNHATVWAIKAGRTWTDVTYNPEREEC